MKSSSKLWPLVLAGALAAQVAQAAAIRLVPATPTVAVGSGFDVTVIADIDPAEEIIGFGFDLLNVSANIGFLGFTAGPGFADDPVFLAPLSDADGIRGASAGSLLLGPPVSGIGVELGQLHFSALALGTATVSLTADDLGANFTEGLIPLSLSLVNFMPPVTDAVFDVVPDAVGLAEPAMPMTLALAALAALAASSARRRQRG